MLTPSDSIKKSPSPKLLRLPSLHTLSRGTPCLHCPSPLPIPPILLPLSLAGLFPTFPSLFYFPSPSLPFPFSPFCLPLSISINLYFPPFPSPFPLSNRSPTSSASIRLDISSTIPLSAYPASLRFASLRFRKAPTLRKHLGAHTLELRREAIEKLVHNGSQLSGSSVVGHRGGGVDGDGDGRLREVSDGGGGGGGRRWVACHCAGCGRLREVVKAKEGGMAGGRKRTKGGVCMRCGSWSCRLEETLLSDVMSVIGRLARV